MLIIGVVFFTLLPYLFGALVARGDKYLWINHNTVDACVYLAWMRQAQEGHFFFENRFTTDPHPRLFSNLFFWMLGTLARWTALPPMFWFHAARMGFGIVWLWVLWLLYRQLLPERARLLALWWACVSAGIGWLTGGGPIDLWQTEAFTFQCLYISPLLVVSSLLMTAFMYDLWWAIRQDSWRSALRAGGWILLLGNIHTYDVLQLAGAWTMFLLTSSLVQRRWEPRRWGMVLTAGSFCLPTAGYQYWVYQTDPVFRQRAQVLHPPPEIWNVLGGYAPHVILAAVAVVLLVRERRCWDETLLLLLSWAVVGVGLQYVPGMLQALGWSVPVGFARRTVMGAHLPLCALAAWGLWLSVRRLPVRRASWLVAAVLFLTTPTHIEQLLVDGCSLLRHQPKDAYLHRSYLPREVWEALQWLGDHTRPQDGVLTSHLFGMFIPAYAGNRVYVAHWGETPQFDRRKGEAQCVLDLRCSDSRRLQILRQARVRYILTFSPTMQPHFDFPLRDFLTQPLPGTRPVFHNRLVSIWKVAE